MPVNAPNNIVFTLYGSDSEGDEKDWIQLTSFKTPTRYGKFDTVEYKYFKIEATSPPTPYSVSGSTTIPSPYDLSLNTLDKCKQHLWFLGYIGEGVKFTTPPPAGATITIDADTDLPMLGPELVMDVTTTVTFQF